MAFKKVEYDNNYQKENYDRISINVSKGEREKIREYAKSKGYSGTTEYIKALIKRDMAGGALTRTAPGIVRRFPPAAAGCRPPRMKTCINGLTIHAAARRIV